MMMVWQCGGGGGVVVDGGGDSSCDSNGDGDGPYPMQLIVQSAWVAHRLTLAVPSPQSRIGRVAVAADQADPTTLALERERYG